MKKLLIIIADKVHKWGNKHPDSILWVLALPLFLIVVAYAVLQLAWDSIWIKIRFYEHKVKLKW